MQVCFRACCFYTEAEWWMLNLQQYEWASTSKVDPSLGSTVAAASCRAQQRGQSPHTPAMCLPDGTEWFPDATCHLKNMICGVPLTNALVWRSLQTPNIHSPFSFNQPDSRSRRFVVKQFSSSIYILLSTVFASNLSG